MTGNAPNQVRVRFIYSQYEDDMHTDPFLGHYRETDILPLVDMAERKMNDYFSVMIIKQVEIDDAAWLRTEEWDEAGVNYDGTTLYIHTKRYGMAYRLLQQIFDELAAIRQRNAGQTQPPATA